MTQCLVVDFFGNFLENFQIFLAIFSTFKLFLNLFFTFYQFFWRLLASLKEKNAKEPLKILIINRHRLRFLEGERKSCATSLLMYLRGPPVELAGLSPDWSELRENRFRLRHLLLLQPPRAHKTRSKLAPGRNNFRLKFRFRGKLIKFFRHDVYFE